MKYKFQDIVFWTFLGAGLGMVNQMLFKDWAFIIWFGLFALIGLLIILCPSIFIEPSLKPSKKQEDRK